MTDEEYYWEKAEFQDPWAHAEHVKQYMLGNCDSKVEHFDAVYRKEAEEAWARGVAEYLLRINGRKV